MTDERWHLRAVELPAARLGGSAAPGVVGNEPADWWIAGGCLSRRPVDGARELPGGWVAPGLVDAHAHLTFEARDRLGLERGSYELVAAHLAEQRRAGVLAVRDAGSLPGVALEAEPEAADA